MTYCQRCAININWQYILLLVFSLKKLVLGVNSVAYKNVKYGDYRERRNFSRIRNTYELKDLLEIQKKSYEKFINEGIKEVF